MRGTVRHFNKIRQYGFVEPATGGDSIFFGRVSLPYDVDLTHGAVVSFDVGSDREGRTVAKNLRLISE